VASIDVTVTTAPITVTVDDGTIVTVGAGTVGPAGPKGDAGTNGTNGTNGQGVPTGGTTGQVLAKKTGTNYDTEWVAQTGGGGSGTVTSVTGTAPIAVATGTTTPVVSIAAATTSAAGSMSATDKSKLDGVATGATANSSDATLLARANHTGTQALSTISDAGTAAAKNVPAIGNASPTEVVYGTDTRLTDARTPSSTLSHAASHGSAGSDPVTLAVSQVTGAVPSTRTVAGKALSADVTLTAADVSAVPTTRTVNAKALSADVTLTAADVSAVPTTRTVNAKALDADVTLTAADVSAVPTTRTVSASTGLTGGGDLSANRSLAVSFGTTSSTVMAGNASTTDHTTFTNANKTLTNTRQVIAAQTGTLSATRTVTLPAAADVAIGSRVVVFSGAGCSPTTALSVVTAAGADYINGVLGGSVSITTANNARHFFSNGVDGWYADVPGVQAKAVGGQGSGSVVTEPTSLSSLAAAVTLPACVAGDVIIVDAGITFTQNNTGSKNYTFAIKLGATTMLSTLVSVTQSATARTGHLHGVIRVLSTTSQSGAITMAFNTNSSGSTGVVTASTGTATETISSGTLSLDVQASTSAAGATQTFQLTSLSVNKVAN